MLLWLLGCARPTTTAPVPVDTAPDTETGAETEPPPTQTGAVVLQGATLAGAGSHTGQVADVRLEDGVIVEVGAVSTEGAEVIDLAGQWLAPAFIDSHVHLAYRPDSDGMLDGGVAVAVDLAAPMDALSDDPAPLRLLQSGPMVTAEGGYPTQSWGSNGYGLECADEEAAVTAVETLQAAGAAVIKLPITGSAVLSDAALAAATARAHDLGMRVASHATSDETARRAADAGVDVLAHMPTSVLSEATVAALADRAVIPTLAAFGGSAAADNLRALREAGATVLYGTDYGNLSTAGIVGAELSAMASAGMTGAEILDAGTVVPADWWGLTDHGRIQAGAAASLLVLDADPTADPLALASPAAVWIAGVQR